MIARPVVGAACAVIHVKSNIYERHMTNVYETAHHLLVDLHFSNLVSERVQFEMKRLQVGEVGAVRAGLHIAGEADDEVF